MRTSPARLLREFHETFDVYRQDRPAPPPLEVAATRQRLLGQVAHELADVVYVAYGTALA